jgi:membrane protein involved in colicin uptake
LNYLKLNPKSLQNYIDSKHDDDIDEEKIDRKFEDEIIHLNTRLRTRALYKELNKIMLDDHDSDYEMVKAMEIEKNTKYKKKRQDIDAKKAEEQRIAEEKKMREASWAAEAEARKKEEEAARDVEEAAKAEKAAADPVKKRSLLSFQNPFKFGGTKRKTTTKRTSKKRRSKK